MNIIIFVAIIFATYQLPDTEAGLSIVSYDVECPIADPEYFRDIEVYIEDEGKDNEFFINFTIIKSLPATAIQTLKMIGSSMGEFVVSTGINFSVDMCEAMVEPIFGERLYHAIGLDPKVCPALPGVYGGNHINLVNQDTLPDTFPPNNYKIETGVYEKNRALFICHTFFKIQ